MRRVNTAHLGVEEKDLRNKGRWRVSSELITVDLRQLTEMPSVSNKVAAVATRETINFASSMREPFSSKAAERVAESNFVQCSAE